jgi:hypothetical protein
MRTHTAFAALLIAGLLGTASLAPVPVSADATRNAQLHLRVVDSRDTALPGATVTVYTLDGKPGVTAVADANGVVSFPDVGTGLAQVVAKSARFATSIDKMTLQPGANAQTVALQLAQTE